MKGRNKKTVIFDLDGTLANISKRRALANLPNGKIKWEVFFNPQHIPLDEPNGAVIAVLKAMKNDGYGIAIFSGRSDRTKEATIKWLKKHDVPYDFLKMRPQNEEFAYMPDEKLKRVWLKQFYPDKNEIQVVFDDRQKVVDMWRSEGLNCFQVAPGNF